MTTTARKVTTLTTLTATTAKRQIEVQGYTLRGYHNGTMVLEATDTDGTRISDGLTSPAARWSNGNLPAPSRPMSDATWVGL